MSIGDYKHKDLNKLKEAYEKVYFRFLDISMYLNLSQEVLSNINRPEQQFYDTLIKFAGIHFPANKVRKLACGLFSVDKAYVDKILKVKNNCSLKKFKAMLSFNEMLKICLEITIALVEHRDDCPKAVQLLKDLRSD